MVKISDNEVYLNSSMAKDGDVVKILDGGKLLSAEENGLDRGTFEIGVQLSDGRRKTWSMNKTTQRRLASAWDDDTENWVGKLVKVEVVKQLVSGVTKNVLYGIPSEPKPQPTKLV